jgi:hypothetical protein
MALLREGLTGRKRQSNLRFYWFERKRLRLRDFKYYKVKDKQQAEMLANKFQGNYVLLNICEEKSLQL